MTDEKLPLVDPSRAALKTTMKTKYKLNCTGIVFENEFSLLLEINSSPVIKADVDGLKKKYPSDKPTVLPFFIGSDGKGNRILNKEVYATEKQNSSIKTFLEQNSGFKEVLGVVGGEEALGGGEEGDLPRKFKLSGKENIDNFLKNHNSSYEAFYQEIPPERTSCCALL